MQIMTNYRFFDHFWRTLDLFPQPWKYMQPCLMTSVDVKGGRSQA